MVDRFYQLIGIPNSLGESHQVRLAFTCGAHYTSKSPKSMHFFQPRPQGIFSLFDM